ncbi:TIFY domain/Divergent CCT motif family protein, putative isoform 6 [Hibiscus syriacus]|uniref:Protein TIFY n=1 Tax=Hibiscus syriacus TaxID=106335 RepID=A0A6A3AM61_HIBSY|nr:TIFY domain/Divergent CCT motif family protein, putative isoform 6 [Hibiscus syriacus]
MSLGETVSRSPLDKPLNQLTEDDISQVTREDCRRYLKEKGMRKPSWNKSQAIQQVISLKNLLETTSDSDATDDARKKLYTTCPQYPPRAVSDSTVLPNEMTLHDVILAQANESISCSRPNPLKSEFSGDISGRTVAARNDSVSPRTAGAAAKESAGQMTVFYCGKVNVYDDMPSCKAEAILQLAASPVSLPHEILADQRTTPWSIPCHSQAASVKTSPCSPMVILPPQQTVNLAENCQFPREECNASLEDNLGKLFLLITHKISSFPYCHRCSSVDGL